MGLNDFKLEETQESGVTFPFVKSSIHSVFQDFSRTRITFPGENVFWTVSDCHVQPNVWKDCKGKYYFGSFSNSRILQDIQTKSTAI